MDPVMMEKLQAMKMYRRRRSFYYTSTIFQFSFTTIFLGLFLSSPIWLPNLYYCTKFFLFYVSKMAAMFFICNLIVVLLASDMKLKMPPKEHDIYEEYVESSRRMQTGSVREPRVGSKSGCFEKPLMEAEDEVEEEEEVEEGEVEINLDELNKKVEDFIARVTEQRNFEKRLLATG